MGADQVEQDIRGIAEHIAAMGLDFNRLAFRKPAIERQGRPAPIDHGNLGFNASLSKYPQHQRQHPVINGARNQDSWPATTAIDNLLESPTVEIRLTLGCRDQSEDAQVLPESVLPLARFSCCRIFPAQP